MSQMDSNVLDGYQCSVGTEDTLSVPTEHMSSLDTVMFTNHIHNRDGEVIRPFFARHEGMGRFRWSRDKLFFVGPMGHSPHGPMALGPCPWALVPQICKYLLRSQLLYLASSLNQASLPVIVFLHQDLDQFPPFSYPMERLNTSVIKSAPTKEPENTCSQKKQQYLFAKEAEHICSQI